MAFLLILLRVLKLTVFVWGMMYPRIRYVEDELPDTIVDENMVVVTA